MNIETHKTFFERLAFLPFNDRLDIELAYALMKYWFRTKLRRELVFNSMEAEDEEVRYFEHLRRVALILIDELKIDDPEMIIAALCHDAIEDTREDDLAASQIEKRFGKSVIRMVKLLSKVPKEGYLDRLTKFGDYRTLMLKAADRLDNLRSLKYGSLKFQHKQIDETKEKYFALFENMIKIAPELFVDKTQYLNNAIHKIVDEFVFEQHPRKFSVVKYKNDEAYRKMVFTYHEEYGCAELVDENGKLVMSMSLGNLAKLNKPIDEGKDG